MRPVSTYTARRAVAALPTDVLVVRRPCVTRMTLLAVVSFLKATGRHVPSIACVAGVFAALACGRDPATEACVAAIAAIIRACTGCATNADHPRDALPRRNCHRAA